MTSVPAPTEARTNSLFQSDWWLDAVAPKQWAAVEFDDGSGVRGRWPYVSKSRWGYRISTQPALTQTLGPWIDFGVDPAKRLARSLEALADLSQKLPPFDYFGQGLHYSVECALPCHWRGFSLYTRYTHVLEDLPAATDISYFRPNIRGDIKKALRLLTVRDDLGLNVFLNINRLSFERQGLALPYDPAVLERVIREGAARDACKLYFAVDAQDRVHAVLCVVRDARCTYYLLGGADPALRSSGAQSLLVSHAIKEAATYSKVFDFEGSMSQSIARFFQGFNPQIKPFIFAERSSRRFAPVLALRRFRAALSRRA